MTGREETLASATASSVVLKYNVCHCDECAPLKNDNIVTKQYFALVSWTEE